MSIYSVKHLASISDKAERLHRRDGREHAIVRLDSGALKSNPSLTDLTTDYN